MSYEKTFADEDIYLYGNMEFEGAQDWQILHRLMSLEERLTSGRFAEIFKARYTHKGKNKKAVVAKVMKSMYNFIDTYIIWWHFID